jgi:hypothetical protein
MTDPIQPPDADDAARREKTRAERRAYYKKNSERINAERRRRYAADAEYRTKVFAENRKTAREHRLRRTYGISLQDYDLMFARQGGRCAGEGAVQVQTQSRRRARRWPPTSLHPRRFNLANLQGRKNAQGSTKQGSAKRRQHMRRQHVRPNDSARAPAPTARANGRSPSRRQTRAPAGSRRL